MGLLVSGCASIVDGGSQNINLVPSNSKDRVEATVITKNRVQVVTLPSVIHTDRSNQDIIVKIEENNNKCYEESIQIVPSHTNPFVLGNIISGGLFGSTTDAITGAFWEYDDNVVINANKKDSCKSK